jgi:hypothetical protein
MQQICWLEKNEKKPRRAISKGVSKSLEIKYSKYFVN